MEFARFRAFKNAVREEEEPLRFVDGELIERFLDVGEDVQKKAIEGLGVGLEEVRGLVEGLRRLR
jgi:DNA damage-binding protein 1